MDPLNTVDDIFIIWQGTKDEFVSLVEQLNKNGIGLKFTYEMNPHMK